jgi:methionine biosynthesis protein MetW
MWLDTVRAYTTPRPDIAAVVPASALRILDIGCSNGAVGASLRASKPGRSVHGVELNPALAEEAKRKLDRVIEADLNLHDWSAGYPDDYFDCIIFADVLEHLYEPEQVLRHSARLVSPDGLIIISLPNIRHVSALHSIFIKGTFPRSDRGIFDHTHVRWFTLADATEMCKCASLSVVAVSSHLRWFDRPGGRVNEWVSRSLTRFASAKVVREFLSYQFVLVTKRMNS